MSKSNGAKFGAEDLLNEASQVTPGVNENEEPNNSDVNVQLDNITDANSATADTKDQPNNCKDFVYKTGFMKATVLPDELIEIEEMNTERAHVSYPMNQQTDSGGDGEIYDLNEELKNQLGLPFNEIETYFEQQLMDFEEVCPDLEVMKGDEVKYSRPKPDVPLDWMTHGSLLTRKLVTVKIIDVVRSKQRLITANGDFLSAKTLECEDLKGKYKWEVQSNKCYYRFYKHSKDVDVELRERRLSKVNAHLEAQESNYVDYRQNKDSSQENVAINEIGLPFSHDETYFEKQLIDHVEICVEDVDLQDTIIVTKPKEDILVGYRSHGSERTRELKIIQVIENKLNKIKGHILSNSSREMVHMQPRVLTINLSKKSNSPDEKCSNEYIRLYKRDISKSSGQQCQPTSGNYDFKTKPRKRKAFTPLVVRPLTNKKHKK